MKRPSLSLERAFEPRHGEAVPVAPGVLRITAPNGSAFTFHGTNSYLLGEERLFLLDPGPDDARHLAVLEQAVAGRPVEAILLTHTHRDHTALVRQARKLFDAPVWAEGPHRPSRPLRAGEGNALDSAGDMDLAIDRTLGDGERLSTDIGTLEVVATPGHTANHLAFAFIDGAAAGTLFSGDHVMAWSTTIVAPPDGAMADYMASLDKLMARSDSLYLPGHGGEVKRPRAFVRAIKAHRLIREAAIVAAVRNGDDSVAAIVSRLYRDTDPKLHGAAGLSVLAHLEDLVRRGQILADGPPSLGARYRLA
ncbi:MBL fold metallo-hydrolase [Aureimonas psammosilenae]|uniref:MBL fold metallo-hydrolase n=1 Tax=Aureimonas psammosilenae TaxID=2495496 RepID=UPI001F1892E8|nr:MBL fold metallo-hydrolase [Aureimonas psammosilenae]